ncbi:hypothetical protein lerEdw1_019478 [Lerista edwardsae]|nr:hypothetical protein lerEdw1_019478 [Lerista edwardsae]
MAYLTITNVQPEDEADYYCSAWYNTGINAQGTVTQPASESASLGQTVELSCTRSSGGSWNSYSHWYQQKLGEKPRFVIYGSSRGEGISDRFSSSYSGVVNYLTITNVQNEDEGDYYCCYWYSSGSMHHGDTI